MFRVTFDTSGDTFAADKSFAQDHVECGLILHGIADDVINGSREGYVIDSNGYAIGQYCFAERDVTSALKTIADMEINENTNHAQLSALCVAIAKSAIA